jgi:hypothetical protein
MASISVIGLSPPIKMHAVPIQTLDVTSDGVEKHHRALGK